MAAIPELKSRTSQAIDAWYEATQETGDDATLRCSSLGKSCDRRLWFAYRWAHPKERFGARILRVFENGKQREATILNMLRGAGISIREIDEETGLQFRVVLAGGALTGSCDGIAEDVPEAPATPHLVEIKTMNNKRWQEWRRKGVAASDPVYYVQCQLYMHGLGLARCLFVAENQDTKEIEVERIKYDALFAAQQIARAERIAGSDAAPPRISDDPDWYECRTCPANAVCHGDQIIARRNCRTCLASANRGDKWRCRRRNFDLTPKDQENGCSVHLYLPALVPGKQIDADLDAGTVSYLMDDGSTYIDGAKS